MEFEHWWRKHGGDASLVPVFQSCFEVVENRSGHSAEAGVNLAEFEEVIVAVAADGWVERPNPQTGEREWENQKTKETSQVDPVGTSQAVYLEEFLGQIDALRRETRNRKRASSMKRSKDGEDDEEDDESNFVPAVKFDFDGKLGPWLSTPEGEPTKLSYCVYAWTIGYFIIYLFFGSDGAGVFNKLGCERQLDVDEATDFATEFNITALDVGGCNLKSVAGTMSLVTHACLCIYLITAGPAAFHSLRLVTRSADVGGHLALLGAQDAQISKSAARSLLRWAWGITIAGAIVGIIFSVVGVTMLIEGLFRAALLYFGMMVCIICT
jgi:hypothetical protein